MGMAKDWGYCKGSRESYRNWGFSCRSFGDAHLLVETKAGANCLGRKVRRGEKSAPPPPVLGTVCISFKDIHQAVLTKLFNPVPDV